MAEMTAGKKIAIRFYGGTWGPPGLVDTIDKAIREAEAAAPEIRCGATDILRILREEGWRVAVHNDYTLAGSHRTFWLLTHPNGQYVKGEGQTDYDALLECQAAIRARGEG